MTFRQWVTATIFVMLFWPFAVIGFIMTGIVHAWVTGANFYGDVWGEP